jgi:two-component system phosphate regulon sensor histidine kinase PhoR
MAASYNVEIVHEWEDTPWGKIIAGSFGFIGIISALILFFARLLREMRISQVQADFLDRISHELRTPLSTLTLVSDLLRHPDHPRTPDEEEKLWRSHSLELERLRTDVELLLQAARLRESRLKVNLEKIDVNQWFLDHWQEFLDLLGPEAELELKGDRIQRTLMVDPALFELIFRNLFDNARKFALGRAKVSIQFKTIHARFMFNRSRWKITVEDQGLGFTPEKEKALFKRFSRLEGESSKYKTHSIPGTGLGLYLSASASKAMGLTLTGKSKGEGQGAQFVIEGFFQ